MNLKVTAYGRTLTFRDPSWETEARWNGSLSPEPETVAWIDGMKPGEVFFDVGANVGRFSVLAACRGLKVFAFEPEAERYAELCRAVRDNDLDVVAYAVALDSGLRVGCLESGRSTHTFQDTVRPGQGVVSLALDRIVAMIDTRVDHIKIDVDGNEPDILLGGRMTIAGAKSVLVEIDPGARCHNTILPAMEQLGFSYSREQVDACTERGGKFDGLANYIFRKM